MIVFHGKMQTGSPESNRTIPPRTRRSKENGPSGGALPNDTALDDTSFNRCAKAEKRSAVTWANTSRRIGSIAYQWTKGLGPYASSGTGPTTHEHSVSAEHHLRMAVASGGQPQMHACAWREFIKQVVIVIRSQSVSITEDSIKHLMGPKWAWKLAKLFGAVAFATGDWQSEELQRAIEAHNRRVQELWLSEGGDPARSCWWQVVELTLDHLRPSPEWKRQMAELQLAKECEAEILWGLKRLEERRKLRNCSWKSSRRWQRPLERIRRACEGGSMSFHEPPRANACTPDRRAGRLDLELPSSRCSGSGCRSPS